jgi:hypothetical protein
LQKKNQAKQKLRSKELETVLDTGEKAELYKEFLEMNTELAIYSKRYEKLNKLNENTLQSYKDMTVKLREFEKDYNKIKDKADIREETPEKGQYLESSNKKRRKLEGIKGEYESKVRVLGLKIKKLEEESATLLKSERELKEKIEVRSKESKLQQLNLNDLQIKANYAQRRIINDDFMSDDLMFLTEQA